MISEKFFAEMAYNVADRCRIGVEGIDSRNKNCIFSIGEYVEVALLGMVVSIRPAVNIHPNRIPQVVAELAKAQMVCRELEKEVGA